MKITKVSHLVTLLIIAFLVTGLIIWVGSFTTKPAFYAQVANWGGGEQLVYGLDLSGTPVPISLSSDGVSLVGINSSGTPIPVLLGASGEPVSYGVGASGTPVPSLVDNDSGATVGIEFEHYKVHIGRSFRLDANDSDFDTNDVLSFAFITPAESISEIHLSASAYATGLAIFQISEGCTVTLDSGAAVTPIQRDRGSTNLSGLLDLQTVPITNSVTITPTITNDGTILRYDISGAGKEKLAAESRDLEEIVLAENTVYCIKLTSGALNLHAHLSISWYEVVP